MLLVNDTCTLFSTPMEFYSLPKCKGVVLGTLETRRREKAIRKPKEK